MSDDPPASLLTNAQREYLRGEKEYRPSVEADVRRRIRDRVEAGIGDLGLLARSLDDNDLSLIFDAEEEEWEEGEASDEGDQAVEMLPRARMGVPAALTLFLQGVSAGDQEFFANMEGHGPALREFTRDVERAYERYLAADRQRDADVTVTVQFDNITPIEQVREEVVSDATDTGLEEMATLSRAGFSDEEIKDMIRESRSEESPNDDE